MYFNIFFKIIQFFYIQNQKNLKYCIKNYIIHTSDNMKNNNFLSFPKWIQDSKSDFKKMIDDMPDEDFFKFMYLVTEMIYNFDQEFDEDYFDDSDDEYEEDECDDYEEWEKYAEEFYGEDTKIIKNNRKNNKGKNKYDNFKILDNNDDDSIPF